MAYLDTIKSGAIDGWRKHKILPSVTGAQAALESGWGTSQLAKPPYNNQFGIKVGDDWTGRTVVMPTREYTGGVWQVVNATFRAYDDPADSVSDHGAFFTSSEWRKENYKHVVGETDYKKSCRALSAAGYATDPGYPQKLINIIEQYNLQAWDREALSGATSGVIATPTPAVTTIKTVGGELTAAGRSGASSKAVTVIGDSLGVGTESYLKSIISNSNYNVLGSRQITHATNSLNATYVLQQMKNAGTLKDIIVVIIGTNRGVTPTEIDNFVNIAGPTKKVLFVDTASQVSHAGLVTQYYSDASKRLSNAFFVDWSSYAKPLLPELYTKDGANGTYIHMTPAGYKRHAEYIAQAVYEAATGDFSGNTASTAKAAFTNIADIELTVDGLIKTHAYEPQSDGTSKKVEFTKQTDIKGLHSPMGDKYIYNSAVNQEMGFGDSVNNSNWIDGVYENTERGDAIMLIEEAARDLLTKAEPERTYTIKLADVPETLAIGDTGIFIDHHYNPPKYIQARVVSLTTSQSRPSLNKVTISNVVELYAQDKSYADRLREELRAEREEFKRDWIDTGPVETLIASSNGLVLGDKFVETQLMLRVIQSGQEITDSFKVKWERTSGYADKDELFNAELNSVEQSSALTVMAKDIVGNQSKFTGRIYNDASELVGQGEITLKSLDTALWTDTDEEPPDAKDGAVWTKPDGSQWVKENGKWNPRVNEDRLKKFQDALKAEIDKEFDEMAVKKEDLEQRYQDAVKEADRLATEKANAVSQEVATVKRELTKDIQDGYTDAIAKANAAVEASDKANKLKFDAMEAEIDQVDKDIGTTQEVANKAQQDVEKTAREFGSFKETTFKDVKTKSDQAYAKAEQADGRVNDVKEDLNGFSRTLAQVDKRTTIKETAGNQLPSWYQTNHKNESVKEIKKLSDLGLSPEHIVRIGSEVMAKVFPMQEMTVSAYKSAKKDPEVIYKVYADNDATKASAWFLGNRVIDSVEEGSNKALVTSDVLADGTVKQSIKTDYVRYDRVGQGSTWGQMTMVADAGLVTNTTKRMMHVEETVDGVKRTIASLEESLGGENIIEKFNELSETVGESKQTIGRLTQDMANRVLQSEFNAVKNTVDSHSRDLVSMKEDIGKRLLTTDFNTVKDTVTSHTQTIGTLTNLTTIQSRKGSNQPPSWYKSNYANRTVREIKNITDVGLAKEVVITIGDKTFAIPDKSVTLTVSAYKALKVKDTDTIYKVYADSDTTKATAWFLGSRVIDSVEEASLEATLFTEVPATGSVKQTLKTDYNRYERSGDGSSWSNWIRSADAGKMSNDVLTAMSQFNIKVDEIQLLTVSKTGLIAEINQRIGRTVIRQGDNKLVLTEDNFYIPTATIKDAHLESANVNKLIGNTAEFNALFAKSISANAVKASHIQVDNAFIDKFTATTALIDRFFAKTAVINSVKAAAIEAARGDFVELRSRILTANVVTASMLKVDDALFTRLFANEAAVQKLVATTAYANSLKALKISANQIEGGEITGVNFSTTSARRDFNLSLSGGMLSIKRAIFVMANFQATYLAVTGEVVGSSIVKYPGYTFSLSAIRNDGTGNHTRILTIPEDATGENRKLEIDANADLTIRSDKFYLLPEGAYFYPKLYAYGGFGHAAFASGITQSDKDRAGAIIFVLDKAGSELIHVITIQKKDGTHVNSGFALYEDGRIARFKNGTWVQF